MQLAFQLDETAPFGQRLQHLADEARAILDNCPPLRLAIAIYHAASDTLHTFADNSDGSTPLSHYSVHLADVPSLAFARNPRGQRVVDDLSMFDATAHRHTAKLLEKGYHASYARAVHFNGHLQGVLFINSVERGFFTPQRVKQLEPIVQIASLHLLLEISHIHAFSAAITSAKAVGAYRDTDTTQHLIRMSSYTALIADAVSATYGFDDAFVADLREFAAMHDIGKVGVPDAILLKPGPLSAEEFEVMKTHVRIGADMVDRIIAELSMEKLPQSAILRNIILRHHERMDGSGYPDGLKGDDIPIEAQILAVADVFDALTARRPYKEPWPLDRALAELRKLVPHKLNIHCVAALENSLPQLQEILARNADPV